MFTNSWIELNDFISLKEEDQDEYHQLEWQMVPLEKSLGARWTTGSSRFSGIKWDPQFSVGQLQGKINSLAMTNWNDLW